MSRTEKSLSNFKYSFLFFLLTLVLNFYSRKIFLDELGIELLGVNTAVYNIINFLNVVEMGIAVSVSYALYKPLIDKDEKSINEIISIFGRFYRIIAKIIIVVAIIILFLLPMIFRGNENNIYYAYFGFVIIGISTIIGYLYSFKHIIISADQKNYIVTQINSVCKVIKIILQICGLLYLPYYKYEVWLLLELLFSVISIFWLNKTADRLYPFLKVNLIEAKNYGEKYPYIITKIKQLFFHKISAFVLSQSIPLILLYIANVELVGVFSNYQMIIMGITALLGTVFSGMVASVGNLIHDTKNALNVYWEILLIEFILVSSMCFIFYFYANFFIDIWIGEQYRLDEWSFILLTLYLFFNLIRQSDIFLSAYGLFGDIGAPIIELILNLGCSVILGKRYGLPGILAGMNISLFLVVFLWKPFYLFRKGFRASFMSYIIKMISLISLSIISAYAIYSIGSIKFNYFTNQYIDLILSTIFNYGGFVILQFVVYVLFFEEFKSLIYRIKNILKK
ncbi:lipopolysaccharide biosynthesis protein [Riemerella anatipestifer]|uniref:Sugar transporter n=1 Tax=Riemerella anatipestifer TaxID=34085 RepID=A0A1S7DR70_RIEAN|nr:hypothetical protein [Riemerella anatipestifer]AQY21608.1 hypothetical protein AB406_0650 [Riemerella anatipestifer]MCU7542734.1 hypothetical protein [Riemerella anatipestifer]MCW0513521.1 hypothetical protein [Riemerella anatipestifer]MDD1553729.1 sugar transporter [Riemerella anatipestifer]MDD1595310.1 sugar transporter [Riemerella anatipestifer]